MRIDLHIWHKLESEIVKTNVSFMINPSKRELAASLVVFIARAT